MATTRAAVTLFSVLLASPALAQSFDWKPIAATAAGMTLDTVSTHRAIDNGCLETTPAFIQPPFSPAAPNFQKMWAYNAAGIAGMAAAHGIAHLGAKRNPQSKTMKALMFGLKSYGYGAGMWRGAAGVRNLRRCGW